MFKVKYVDSIMMLVRLDLNLIVSLFQHKCEVSEMVSTTTLMYRNATLPCFFSGFKLVITFYYLLFSNQTCLECTTEHLECKHFSGPPTTYAVWASCSESEHFLLSFEIGQLYACLSTQLYMRSTFTLT